MRSLYSAIIHLREPAGHDAGQTIELTLRAIRGVNEVQHDPVESLITVRFDREQTGLAEIVRVVEDLGSSVSGVAQRRASLEPVG